VDNPDDLAKYQSFIDKEKLAKDAYHAAAEALHQYLHKKS
jgi:hypothetical protein